MIDVLCQSMLFGQLTDSKLKEISSIAMQKRHAKGDILFLDGDTNLGFYILVSGKVKIFKSSIDGKELILHIVSRLESFAEAATFGNMPYPASVEALEDSETIFFPKESFMGILLQKPEVAIMMLASMAKRLKKMTDQIHSLTSQSVGERLANFIIASLKKKGIEAGSGTKFSLEVDKHVLASRLGTTPETLSRTFQKAKAEKIITLHRKEVTILDMEKLYQFSSA